MLDLDIASRLVDGDGDEAAAEAIDGDGAGEPGPAEPAPAEPAEPDPDGEG